MYMNELVNFNKIDIIKEMIKEKEQNIDNKTDYDNIAVGDITMNYFYEYIEPILLELNDNGIVEYDKNQIKTNSGTRRVYLKAISFLMETLVAKDDDNNDTKFSSNDNGNKNMFLMFDLDKYRQLCDEKDNYFLASNDTKTKKEFVQKIKEIFEYEYKVINYSENYLKPLLSNLGKSNKIKYFVNTKNE